MFIAEKIRYCHGNIADNWISFSFFFSSQVQQVQQVQQAQPQTQVFQQVLTPSGEVQNVPVSISFCFGMILIDTILSDQCRGLKPVLRHMPLPGGLV